MNIDDVGVEAGRDVVGASRSITVPSVDAVKANRRLRSGLGAGAAAVLAVGAIAIGSAVSTPDDDRSVGTTVPVATTTRPTMTTTTRPADTTIPPQASDGGFIPPTVTRDGRTEVTLRLLDGSIVTLSYSADLDLTSGGFTSLLAGRLGDDVNRNGREISTRYGSIEDFVEELDLARDQIDRASRTSVLREDDPGRVERWEFGWIAYLLFEFDGWTAAVWDGVPGGPNPVMSDQDQQAWASLLGGTVDGDGFLTLTGAAPLHLVPAWDERGPSGPDGQIDGASGGLGIFLNDCDRMGDTLADETYDPPVFAWCDVETNTLFFAFGNSAEINQKLHETLEVRRLNVAEVGWVKPTVPVFVPPTSTEGDRTVLPLTFPDGSRAELVYPSGIDLTSHGVGPYSSGSLSGIGRDFNIYFGTVEETLGRFTVEQLGAYPDADGNPVGFYHLADYGLEVNHLAFEFDGWTVLVYDYTTRFDGGAATMSDEQRATWARSFHGRVDQAGFLILTADPPLRLAEAGDHAGPSLSVGGEHAGLGLVVGPCEPYEDPQADPTSGQFSWCDPVAGMVVHASGDAEFIALMREQLEIRRP
jgi:hypothetical protein